jgi:hypothetical protein
MFEAIEMCLNNSSAINAGFKRIFGIEKYLIVKDKKGNIVCLFHDVDVAKALVEKYIEKQGLDGNLLEFQISTIRRKDVHYKKLIEYKIVSLDKKLVLYKDILEKSNTYNIKGFKGKIPKYGINKYETIKEK